MVGEFTPLRVKEVRRETEDASTLFFEFPEGKRDLFHYKPGQYITIRWKEGGKEFRRSYSICSVPGDPFLAITVKEVNKGKISPKLIRTVKAGDLLDVFPPEGRFTTEFDPDKKRQIYLFGAGSGITPLMSISRTALEAEPKSTVILLYGSRTEDQIIFREAFDQLAERYKGQFFVYHTLSKPDGGGGLVKSLFGKKKPEWSGMKGRISAERIQEVLDKHPGNREQAIFFLCGPGDFITMAEKALSAIGINEDLIKKEFFTPPSSEHPTHQNEMTKKTPGHPSKVIVHLRGDRIEATVTNKTILDTLLDLGYDAPYSCHSGACATCMAKVIEGKVEMDACYALSDKEVANGYILSCQSHPITETLEITYDE